MKLIKWTWFRYVRSLYLPAHAPHSKRQIYRNNTEMGGEEAASEDSAGSYKPNGFMDISRKMVGTTQRILGDRVCLKRDPGELSAEGNNRIRPIRPWDQLQRRSGIFYRH